MSDSELIQLAREDRAYALGALAGLKAPKGLGEHEHLRAAIFQGHCAESLRQSMERQLEEATRIIRGRK